MRKLESKVKELGVQKSHSIIFRWLNEMGAQMKRRWIKSSLLDHHRALRTEFEVDQVNNRYGTFRDMFDVVHIDETWFYLMVNGQKFRVSPGKDMPPKLQHKRHVPRVTFIATVANGRHNLDKNFDGKVGIWRSCVVKEDKRTCKNRKRGEEYECDVIIDTEWYTTWYTTHLSPAIRRKMPWMRGGWRSVFSRMVPHPHVSKGNSEWLRQGNVRAFISSFAHSLRSLRT
ncbi:unnamed protein product [Discosporangium mesarthrocarpum]